MSATDELLKPVSEEKPCGPDASTDTDLYALLSELENQAQGTPGQEQVVTDENGNKKMVQAEGTDPDWAEVRKSAKTAELPIILVTAVDPDWGYPVGRQFVLRKPFRADDLLGLLQRL